MPDEKKPQGRPAFEPTDEQRESVAVWRAAGMGMDEIASALGITRPTLNKHFSDELETAAQRKRTEVIEAMFKAAVGGNVSAQKSFIQMVDKAQVAEAEARFVGAQKDTPRLGKKELADEAAKTAGQGTDWGDDLEPDKALPN